MAISPISQPSPVRQPVQQRRGLDWHDKVLRGLQIANQVFQVPVAFSEWEANRADVENKELENKRKKLKLGEEESQAAGFTTPSMLAESKETVITEPVAGIDQEKLGRLVNFATIEDGKKVTQQVRVAPNDLISQLMVTPEKDRQKYFDLIRKNASADMVKKVALAEDASDKLKQTMKNHSFVRRVEAGSRERIGKLTAAYNALDTYQRAIEKGVSPNKKVGENLATAAGKRFVEYYMRFLTGAVATQADAKERMLGVKKEIERISAFLPGPNDTRERAITAIDELRKDIELQAGVLGNGGTEGFIDFAKSTFRETKPLESEPDFQVSQMAEDAAKDFGRHLGTAIIGAGRGVLQALFPDQPDQEPVPLRELESFGPAEHTPVSPLTPGDVGSFGPAGAQQPTPVAPQGPRPAQPSPFEGTGAQRLGLGGFPPQARARQRTQGGFGGIIKRDPKTGKTTVTKSGVA
jgi:hypothetical protein